MTNQQYQKCIDACIECATVCNHCAISCLEEKDVQYLVKCIRLDLECAAICRASAELMTLGSGYTKEMCDLCASVCNACAEMCEQHANMGMDHCRECAEACRACAKELMEVSQNLAKENSDTKPSIVHQEECAILSRVAAELISLSSAYGKEIIALTSTICNAASETLQTDLDNHKNQSRHHASISKEVQEHLENQEETVKNESKNDVQGNNEKTLKQKEAGKNQKKHSSALLAASMWRSPVHHALRHASGGLYGSYANTGTNISYDEQDI